MGNSQYQYHQFAILDLINYSIFPGSNPEHIFRRSDYFSRPFLVRIYFKRFNFNSQLRFYFIGKFVKGFFGGWFKKNGISNRQYPIPFLCPPMKFHLFLSGLFQFRNRQQYRQDTHPRGLQRSGSWADSGARRQPGGHGAFSLVNATWWWMQS